MTEAVIVEAVRTPVATARKGSLAFTRAEDVARTILTAAIERSGVPKELVDDVIFAESMLGGGAIARHAAIEAGIQQSGGMAVNRHCAGSLTAVGIAAAQLVGGMEQLVVAGGIQSTSTAPVLSWRDPATGEIVTPFVPPTHPDRADAPNRDMSITVGWNTAQIAGLRRDEMDAWALRSHQRAVAAIDAGHFADEIVPVTARAADGSTFLFSVDEYPRRDSSAEKLASLKPIHPEIEGFSITAGNSSGVNDAASAIVLARDDFARSHGLNRRARVLAWTALGVDPYRSGMAVIDIVEKALRRTGRTPSDVALWEINEAFASVPLAACRHFGLDEERVNVSGSGCSIGHPVAASGGRMVATLIRDLERRDGGIGIATMCAGGGQAGLVMIEV